jgi:hypothetical protein
MAARDFGMRAFVFSLCAKLWRLLVVLPKILNFGPDRIVQGRMNKNSVSSAFFCCYLTSLVSMAFRARCVGQSVGAARS